MYKNNQRNKMQTQTIQLSFLIKILIECNENALTYTIKQENFISSKCHILNKLFT